ncbi:MAG: metallophosphoesterase family protein [Oscillospiraceae bacterium]|jgi:hypothetical protein|nr:metallophosphoesterase family protein [Oscillospiraceae bacterium]
MNAMQSAKPTLRFRPDGSFSVMQISDIQHSNGLDNPTRTLLEALLDAERPDFVILTGDQVKGYGASLWFGTAAQKRQKIERTLDDILSPLAQRGIPFTFVFGNHDHDAPLDDDEQVRIYQSYPLCCAADLADAPGCANHTVEVLHSAGSGPALNFYLLDSHGAKGLGYQPLRPEQVDWYRRTRDALIARNGGRPVPSLLFQHIAVEEILELYRKVPKGTAGALEGFRSHEGSYYVLDETKAAPGSFMGELPSTPDHNAGLFAAAQEKGDMLGMYFGHDHHNGFHGVVGGVDLGYAPALGFQSYGPGRRRGVRMFRFREEDIARYETYIRTFADLFGEDAKVPWALPVIDAVPSSFGAAKPLVRRSILGLTIASGAAAGLAAVAVLKKRR